jgi:voltage-gated potassium channel Kch
MARQVTFGRRGVLASTANLGAVLVPYFAVPIRTVPSGRLLWGMLTSAAAVAAVAVVTLREARAQAADASRKFRMVNLVLLLEVVLVAFSLAYYLLAQRSGQMEGISTRLDALYFAGATMTTVGYGDVHAVGQLSRAVVLVNLLFDVVFLAALAQIAGENFSRRRR